MGFFTDIVAAATPWSSADAEAVSGGSGTDSTPARANDKGEGEAIDESAPTPDKKDNDDDQVSGKEASGVDQDEAEDEEEEEEEEEEELEDPQEKITEECKESSACRPAKHHFDECVERVTAAQDDEDNKAPNEDCVEEFFHLAHCANQCAAPKLWAALK
ncbi:ubiquinol-cytochrome c reductase complex subunit [Phlyctema vagabunda]|uniref:Ubiquinol-cytochrome c reductase complex subunit n=1 Tax=Phlyctema vagabunda TaxID=108571 RepID=A0ABR4PJY0_9HELO